MNKTLHRIYIGLFFLIGISVTVLLAVNGYSYYTTSVEERFFHPQHNLIKPSGYLGHGFGIVGSLMMILGVSIYMIRKRSRRLFNFGYLKHWLELHIFLCYSWTDFSFISHCFQIWWNCICQFLEYGACSTFRRSWKIYLYSDS